MALGTDRGLESLIERKGPRCVRHRLELARVLHH